MLSHVFHLPLKVLTCYRSAADVVLTIPRKEVDGRYGWSWSSMMTWNKSMYQSKAVDLVLRLAGEKLAELPEVPSILDVARDADQRAALS